MHSPIICVIICFGRIIIDIIILWNEKRCVLFLEGKEMTSTENSDLTDRRLHKRIKLTIQSGKKIHEKKTKIHLGRHTLEKRKLVSSLTNCNTVNG